MTAYMSVAVHERVRKRHRSGAVLRLTRLMHNEATVTKHGRHFWTSTVHLKAPNLWPECQQSDFDAERMMTGFGHVLFPWQKQIVVGEARGITIDSCHLPSNLTHPK